MNCVSRFLTAAACAMFALPTAAFAKDCERGDIAGKWQMTSIVDGKQTLCLLDVARSGDIKDGECVVSPSFGWELVGTIEVDEDCEMFANIKLKRNGNNHTFRSISGIMMKNSQTFMMTAAGKDDVITNFLAFRDKK